MSWMYTAIKHRHMKGIMVITLVLQFVLSNKMMRLKSTNEKRSCEYMVSFHAKVGTDGENSKNKRIVSD